jgi:hypothetical protein
MVGFVVVGLALFKVTLETAIAWRKRDPKTGFAWREIAGSLAVVAVGAAVCAGLFLLLERPSNIAQEAQKQKPPPSCENLEMIRRVPKFPHCAEHAYQYTSGKCDYPEGLIHSGTWPTDRDVELYCGKLALNYEPES